MSDDTDDGRDATIAYLPRRGDAPTGGDDFVMPDVPDLGFDPLPEPAETSGAETVVIPVIPAPPSPADVLAAMPTTGVGADDDTGAEAEDDEETEEYGPRPGLLERLGDWIDHRIRLGDARHAAEAPLREAEIAGKVARLQTRTAQETALMEHNGKLRQAQVKAQGDRAAAKGKADADRIAAQGKAAGAGKGPAKQSGMGVDKGHHKPKPNDVGKAPADRRKAQEMAAAAKANDKARRDNDKARRDAEKADRRKATEQRKADKQAGKEARQKDGGRAGRLGQWATSREDRRAARDAAKAADHKADRKSEDKAADHRRKEEAAQAAHLRREAEKDADYRRKQEAADADFKREKKRRGLDKDDPGGEKGDSEKDTSDSDPEKDPGKESAPDPETGPDGVSDVPDGAPEGDRPGASADDSHGPPDGSGTADPGSAEEAEPDGGEGDSTAGESRWWDRFRKDDRDAHDGGAGDSGGPIPAEEAGITVERPDRPGPAKDAGEPAAIGAGPRGLPSAPEPHTQRPGTTRASAEDRKEEQVNTASAPRRAAGQPHMAARHRASITTYEFVDEMAGIDVQARQCRDVAEKLNEALAKMARELRVWAADLAQDDNIDTAVTDEVTGLADDAAGMSVVMEQFAQGCKTAADHAYTAHHWVENVYGEDIQAMKDSGLKQASAASHH